MRPFVNHPGSRSRRAAGATVVAVLALVLSACGGSAHDGHDAPSAVETARNGDEFNGADVEFATAMIPHHAQAVQMANLAAERTLPDDLRTIAEEIHTAQVSEVETMVTWLTDWGQEIPETSMDHVNAGHGDEGSHDSGHADMPGMMSAAQMDELAAASDADFAELWVTMMIDHHEGAIEMARTEQEDGHFPDAVDLATTIERVQDEEIARLREILDAG